MKNLPETRSSLTLIFPYKNRNFDSVAAWKVSKYGVFSGPDLTTFSEEILYGKLHFLVQCSVKVQLSLELLTPETMKLLDSTEKRKTNGKNCENFNSVLVNVYSHHFIKVILVHYNVKNNTH